MKQTDIINVFITEVANIREEINKVDNRIVPDFRVSQNNNGKYDPTEDLKKITARLRYSVETMEESLAEDES